MTEYTDPNLLTGSEDCREYLKAAAGLASMMQGETLSRILESPYLDVRQIQSLFSANGIGFESNLFVTAILAHKDISSNYFMEHGSSKYNPAHDLIPRIRAILEDSLKGYAGVYFARATHFQPVLFSLSPEAFAGRNYEGMFLEFTAIISRVIEEVTRRLGIKLRVSLSRLHVGMGNVSAAYQESLAMDTRMRILEPDELLLIYSEPDDILCSPPKTAEPEALVSVLINSGEYAKAAIELNSYILRTLSDPDIRAETLEMKFAQVRLAVASILTATAASMPTAYAGDMDLVAVISRCPSVSILQQLVNRIMELAALSEPEKSSRPPAWLPRVEEYIERNYTCPDVNLSHLSYVFGIKTELISQAFKRFDGVSVIAYLHKLRLEEAKRLLKRGLSIAQTAQESGCGSTRTLIRMFQKYENINPADYKRIAAAGAGGSASGRSDMAIDPPERNARI